MKNDKIIKINLLVKMTTITASTSNEICLTARSINYAMIMNGLVGERITSLKSRANDDNALPYYFQLIEVPLGILSDTAKTFYRKKNNFHFVVSQVIQILKNDAKTSIL